MEYNHFDDHVRDNNVPELIATMKAVAYFVERHNLHANTLNFEPASPSGALHWDYEANAMVPVPARVHVYVDPPAQFLRWCELLTAPVVLAERREADVCLHARVTRDDIHWNIGGNLYRPARRPHLPGSDVTWDGNHGRLSVAGLRATMAALGVRRRDPGGEFEPVTGGEFVSA